MTYILKLKKSKEADKKNAKLKNPRAEWFAGLLDQKPEQLAQHYSTSVG